MLTNIVSRHNGVEQLSASTSHGEKYKTDSCLAAKDGVILPSMEQLSGYKDHHVTANQLPAYDTSTGSDARAYLSTNTSAMLDYQGFSSDEALAYKSKMDAVQKPETRIYGPTQPYYDSSVVAPPGGDPDGAKCDVNDSTSPIQMTLPTLVDAKTPTSTGDLFYSKTGYMYSSGYVYGTCTDLYTSLPTYNNQYHNLANMAPVNTSLYTSQQTMATTGSPYGADSHQMAYSRSPPEHGSCKHPLPLWIQNHGERDTTRTRKTSPECADRKISDVTSDRSTTPIGEDDAPEMTTSGDSVKGEMT